MRISDWSADVCASDLVKDPFIGEKGPAGQSAQAAWLVAPATSEYFPATHGMQSERSTWPLNSEYVPVGQGWQVSLLSAPGTFEYLPATHSKHDSLEFAPHADRKSVV